jgi:subtilisin family serine protease
MRSISAQEIILKVQTEAALYSDPDGIVRSKNSNLDKLTKMHQLYYEGQILKGNQSLSNTAFQNIHKVKLNSQSEITPLLQDLESHPSVLWAEPNYAYSIHFSPNDSLYPNQWALSKLGMENAWDIEQGNPQIIIGIIDTGIDYLGEDFNNRIWVNSIEDLNHNGKLDSLDINGIDDDQNGYIDDVIGWDFTHAPSYPDNGDFLDPDNDPMDDYLGGHGTPVAGIIGAATDNQLGIAGIAPGIRLMALRAGTASGYLEEDDVAEAIIYAVQNGCKIINMSFGDLVYSHLLKEAVDYGATNGVIFVASAGNSGSQVLQFPAAYDNTISVGATTFENQLAPFSNYGSKIDLVAPGQDILSTGTNNFYGTYSGTSFAAPMVCGVLGLLWSQQPTISREALTGKLITGCLDLGSPGWDMYFGHGLLDAFTSLSSPKSSRARIDYPGTLSGVKDSVITILGTAAGSDFRKYTLSYGIGENPLQMVTFFENSFQVNSDTLGIWEIESLIDTTYTLELRLTNHDFTIIVSRAIIFLDRTAPMVLELKPLPLRVKEKHGFLIEILTDDRTRSTMHYRNLGELNFNKSLISNYLNNRHSFLITQEHTQQEFEYYINLENSSGMQTIADNEGQFYSLNLDVPSSIKSLFERIATDEGTGYFMKRGADFNGDGVQDVIGNIQLTGQSSSFIGSVNFENESFSSSLSTRPAFGRDIFDIDGDGILDLLAGYGSVSYVFNGVNLPQFSAEPKQFNLTDFWAARMANIIDDSYIEILALHLNQWNIYRLENPADLTVTQVQILQNPTHGNNNYGVPYAEITDLNKNGRSEIIIGDYDGDLILFESFTGNQFEPLTTFRLPGEDATHRFATGDVDGDGELEIICATQKLADYQGESARLGQYWILNILKWNPIGKLDIVWEQNIHGITDLRDAYSGVTVKDYDNDGRDEIFFTPYPQAYYIQYENGVYEVNWYYEGINSYSVPHLDDSHIMIATPSEIIAFRTLLTPWRPQPPSRVWAVSSDTSHIEIRWDDVSGANLYLIIRENTGLQQLDSIYCMNTTYLDTIIQPDQVYFYWIQTVDSNFTIPQSGNSITVVVRSENPPRFLSVKEESQNQLLLEFDKPLGEASYEVGKYRILPQSILPTTAVRGKSGYQVLLGFHQALSPGTHELLADHLVNSSGVPFYQDTLKISFQIVPVDQRPYIKRVTMVSKAELLLSFNHPMDQNSVENINNYRIQPDDEITHAILDLDNPNLVHLFLGGKNRMGSLGVDYYLEVSGLQDVWGIPLAVEGGNRLLIQRELNRLEDVVVFPNPLHAGAEEEKITFGNIPLGTEISVYTANGELVKRMKIENTSGGISWELRNEGGKSIGNGVFLFVARYQDQEKIGKFVILR